jgi:hypothetical protein
MTIITIPNGIPIEAANPLNIIVTKHRDIDLHFNHTYS